jgi:hypothetical protein
MAAFNYRDFVRQVRTQSWKFYFQARRIELPECATWEQPEKEVQSHIQAGLDALEDGELNSVYAELRRVKSLAKVRGIQALRNTVPLGDVMLDDFENHASDAERSLWAMTNWPSRFAEAEAILQADAEIGKRTWRRMHLPPGQVLHYTPTDIEPLRQALAKAFTLRKGRPRACEIDVLTRHLDGGVQLDIRVEDNLQRFLEFDSNDRTIWRDVRPPLRMTVIIYPESGVLDLLVVGGEKARKKLLSSLGAHIFKKPIEPITTMQPLFLLNRLRQGVNPDEHSGLDLRDYRVEKARLSECRLRSVIPPICEYQIKPASEKDPPDALDCVRDQHTMALMSTGFNFIGATVSLYFESEGNSKKGRVLHIGLKPTGISNLRDMEEADARLAENLMRALGVMQEPHADEASDQPMPATEGA